MYIEVFVFRYILLYNWICIIIYVLQLCDLIGKNYSFRTIVTHGTLILVCTINYRKKVPKLLVTGWSV